MKNALRRVLVFTLLVFSVFCLAQTAVSEDMITVVGTVNDNFQIVTDDGELYFIGDTEQGAEVEVMTGARVQVTGETMDMDGDLYINITSFTVVQDAGN